MKADKIRKYSLLINISNEILNRLHNTVVYLNNQSLNFVIFVLSITSIFLAVLFFFFQRDWIPSCIEEYFIITYVLLNVIVLVMNFLIIIPSPYKEVAILEEKRFNELSNASEEDLYSGILFNLKETFSHNQNRYSREIKIFKFSFFLFILSTIVLVTLVILNILW